MSKNQRLISLSITKENDSSFLNFGWYRDTFVPFYEGRNVFFVQN
ncbi:hypothetical protein RU93_GL002268 [Enterococcus aquimarinus]|uniref:Uncharacterized protein n=1 Tax=Enterococcus aquimarinus TaxID=328396 RepID=A0A1L8QRV0_9ENTE|nr:hypothetical protein RU93_GL002268 [Enterococcus aquimarinus]